VKVFVLTVLLIISFSSYAAKETQQLCEIPEYYKKGILSLKIYIHFQMKTLVQKTHWKQSTVSLKRSLRFLKMI